MLKQQAFCPRIGTIYQFDKQQVHVLESGDLNARPILVLHGCGSLAEEVLLPFAQSTFRMVAPDRPGYGFSSPLPLAERGPIGQSFWLERLIDAMDLHCVSIVAHSIGSAPALHLAARRSELVNGLLLISPCCRPVPPKPLPILRASVAPVVGSLIRQHVISRWAAFFLDRGLRSSSFPNTLPPQLSVLPAAHMVNPGAIETMANELRAFNKDMELLPKLPSNLPLHVLFGSEDRIVQPAWHIDGLRQKHPRPMIRVIEGVGHLPHHVVPAVARQMLSDLVRERVQQSSKRQYLAGVA
ncbi:alpha/beta hydrolase family protein (plasmid) [Rhizobium sp. TAL182]|uniref:alpha/beta fold hydrolase n=1 Tax=Rhizobium sp. TAL182 TaxID=2020313 RepID=UPI000A210560|nr:alpha/beta hydrolase [Rhizobium sp. TAL182]ARO27641.1 alpha/beta hydrolase family protein [Rhizobium sp. TAL182]